MWINRNLESIFKVEHIKAKQQGLNISGHSFRKSAGLKVYESPSLETSLLYQTTLSAYKPRR